MGKVVKSGISCNAICVSLVAVFLLAPGSVLAVDVDKEWKAAYDGPLAEADCYSTMVIDEDGYMYVTGYTSEMNGLRFEEAASITAKYDPSGDQIWVETYDDPDYWIDRAIYIDIDAEGNVYTLGIGYSATTSWDWHMLAYDNDGDLLWSDTYDGPANGYDSLGGLVVTADGLIVFSGDATVSSGNVDIVTIAYDSEGDIIWTATYDGPDGGTDFGQKIAADPNGMIYVVGYSESDTTYGDFVLIAYDDEGNEEWVSRYDGPNSYDDRPININIDGENNIYVVGYQSPDNIQMDGVILKYDDSGDLLWSQSYNGVDDCDEWITDIAIDSYGNSYAVGSTDATNFMYLADALIISYDESGNYRWSHTYDGPLGISDCIFDIEATPMGYLYCVGSIDNSWPDRSEEGLKTRDVKTWIFDIDGNEIWTSVYQGPGDGFDEAWGIRADGIEDLYIYGTSSEEDTGRDAFIQKYHISLDPDEMVDEIDDYLDDLDDDAFSKNADQRRDALLSKLKSVSKMIDNENYKGAINKLNNDILSKMDGLEGKGNSEDWISDPDAQEDLYIMIDQLIVYLEYQL